jgi:hypothetical protein
LAAASAITFAASITEPPPKAMTASQPSLRYSSRPCSISGIGASAVIPSNTTNALPAARSASVSGAASPSRVITASVTSSSLRWPKSATVWPSLAAEPGPTSSTG